MSPTQLITTDLERTEQKLQALISSREPLLTDIARYLIGGGGKRIRPTVALLVYRAAGGTDASDMIDVAVALELIHSATLLHDDIIDGGEIRRGHTSALRTFGLPDTLVAGDFLFSKAFELCGRFEERIVRWAADACISLTEGEVMQGRFRRNREVTESDYLEIIARKTASLFMQGSRVAAHLAGAPATSVETMARCGFHTGMAFQMVDDLLDVIGDSRLTGKHVGTDLRDGNPSLPIVLSLHDPTVERVFTAAEPSHDDVGAALERLRTGAVVEAVAHRAEAQSAAARELLGALPRSEYRDGLDQLIGDLLRRAL